MNDIKLIQLNNYVRPKVVENKVRNWVMNGKNNEFYQYVIDRQNGSPTNSAILRTYNDLVYGKGLGYKGKSGANDFLLLRTLIHPNELRKIISDFNLFGEAKLQIIRKKNKELGEISHIPNQKVIPSIANEDGIIESYWYSNDWSKTSQNPPEEIPSFGNNSALEIYHIKPYSAGKDYFGDPSYLAALPYCEMEEEIANLNINSIKNGLSAGYIINVPNGNTLTPEEKDEFERQIKQKLTGSPNASRFVLSFNGVDAEITITPFPVNDNVHKQWEFLTAEARQQIITGHRLTSPVLAGVSSADGFSSTADEMDMAEAQLMKRVIAPKQNYIIDAFEDVLRAYDINLQLYFIPLTEEKKAPIVQQELKSHVCCSSDYDLSGVADELIQLGEDISDEWELIDEVEAVDTRLSENMLNTLVQLAVSTPAFDKPRRTESEQDTSIFKVRYKYAGNPNPEREFCKKMMSANKVYRAEDLDKEQKTTPNMGKGGSDKYNVFLYKGGVNCKHFWERQIYMKKGFEKISVNQARKMILELDPSERKEARWEQNPKEVAQIASPSNNHWKVN